MKKLVLIVIVVIAIAAVAYEFTRRNPGDSTAAVQADGEGKSGETAVPRVEEKYGFTTETALP